MPPITSYITQDEYKYYAGISTLSPVQIAQLDVILPSVKSLIDSNIGDLVAKQRTITVQYNDCMVTSGVWKIYTNLINIYDVISINGFNIVEFRTDGKHNSIIYVEPDETTEATMYQTLEIVVENGYIVEDPYDVNTPNSIPHDIKYLSFLLARDSISQISGGNIIKKKVGDKELGFSANTAENIQSIITNIISSYKIYRI